MDSLISNLERSEFLSGLVPRHLATLAECATTVTFAAGEMLCRAGEAVDVFWLVQSGRVALGFFQPGSSEITIATLSEGDVAGFSWLFAPFESRFDIMAVTPVTALRFDGRVLLETCGTDPEFGFQLMSRFTRVIADRVDAMSLQLLDVYGHHPIEHQ
jgi:CRP-like cAMP-binding protein